ncbi:type I polyketide synthase [Sorangium atrum]|uniref:SDR family NAD(P)-dependent oxidoreductase n=1 Tax=Sorangium atrum TaxID=2995308 RepID=A0ABT5C3C8_9BACT|nr:type I polyketide synthase [Sorangium aterium]MDC0680904.1 SDR family NAD(P)-dependent oxidoreductase [Sorangium aterium]
MHPSSSRIPSIAVVGVSAIFPGSLDAHGFWRDILSGTDLITEVPSTHWLVEDYYDPDPSAPDKTYAKRGAFLKNVPFDPLEWGVPPSIVPATDTTQLLALIVAKRVLEDAAQGQFEAMNRERMSVILGVTSAQELLASMVSRIQRPVWAKALRDLGYPEDEVKRACDKIAGNYVPWQESSFPGLLGNVVAGRIANRLDLGGTNCVTDAACASSLSAMSMAINELALGQSDLVIAGGCDTMNDAFMYMCFSKTPALSKSGDCRPFSDKADGTLLGEGIAMVALKRLDDAERDGDRVYAVIRGIGSSSDGRSKSVYAPVPEGQAKAIRRTYAAAGYGPETVELMEAHGTGTKAGDAAEFEGLRAMFDASGRADRQWCALGSVKSQIGHTKAAAGAAGLFKAIMALHHKVLPPTIKVDKPNPKLDIEKTAFYLNTQARPWIRPGDHPRRASVSSFGFGGSNFHVALEEYTGPAPKAWRVRALPAELFLLSADTPAALADRARALAKEAEVPEILRFLARESVLSFDASRPARLGLCAADEADLRKKLEQVAAHLEARPEQALSAPLVHCASGEAPGRVAFLFPGQGSQYVGMGADALMTFDPARAAWDAAAGVAIADAPLHEVVFPRPVFSDEDRAAQEARLRETRWAQPAIGATSLSHLALLAALGVRAEAFAGHSFGEITALHAAGALSAADLLRVARRRGELMGAASSERGAMIAVPRGIDEVRALGLGGVVIANHNGPKQVVLSGSVAAIEAAEERLKGVGIQARRLDVAAAFHSPLVAEASAPLREFLAGIAVEAPAAPVYSNAEIEPYAGGGDAARDRLARQLAEPVRFVEEIERMYADGVRTFVEVGPGSVLTNLVGDILSGRPHRAVALDRKGKHGVTSLLEAVARLAVAGVPLDARVLWEGFAAPSDPRALPKPKLALQINGSNYGKPYPPQGGAKALPAASPPRAAQKPAPEAARAVASAPRPVASASQAVVSASRPAVSASQPAVSASQAAVSASAPVVSASAPVVSASQAAVSASRLAVSASQPAVSASQPVVSASAPALASASAPVVSASRPAVSASQPVVSASAPALASASAPVVSAPRPAVSSSTPVVSASRPTASASWLAAYQEAQRATAEAHSVYQRTMAESHIAFLQAAEASFAGLAALATGAPYPVAPTTVSEVRPAPVLLAPVHVGPVSEASVRLSAAPTARSGEGRSNVALDGPNGAGRELHTAVALPAQAAPAVEAKVAVAAPAATARAATAAPAAAVKAAAAAPAVAVSTAVTAPAAAVATQAAVAAAPRVDIERLVLDVVADKTGYPVSMLGLQMELESDLGIDSIKRVEILSSVRDRTPGLAEVDASALAQLRTLGQVVDYLRASLPAAGPAASASPAVAASTAKVSSVAAPAVASSAAPGAAEVERVVMAVVAETTGYPAEMLGLQMELESDLGIDSIKRVEILSAVRDRTPGLSEVDASALAQLRTLGQVVDHLRASLPAAGPAASASPAAVAPAAKASSVTVPAVASSAAPGAAEVERVVMAVVAETTGYPAEMLGLQMELESDLGIDSIKRVEILSAVRDRTPGLSEVDASALAQLRTLGQVVDHLRASLPAASASPAVAASAAKASAVAAPAAASVAAPGAAEVERVVMAVVAETTGYPAEMLGLQMELESDLGIDSIKRVEILSAVRDRTPGLSEVDASALAQLRTLGQVVDHLRASLPAASASPAVVAPAAATVPAIAAPAAASASAPAAAEVERVVMAVVAETTGYPAEMLGLQMELESDLGIDSIKRVEILSAVRDRTPGLAEVDASALAQLRTLGQVVDHLRASLGSAAVTAGAAPAEPAEEPASAPLGRWTLVEEPAPAAGLAMPGLFDAGTIVVTGHDAIGPALVAALAARGIAAEHAPAVPRGARGAVFLGGLRELATADEALAVHREAFLAAQAIAAKPALFVTVQDTGGDFGIAGSDRAWVGGLPGLVKTAALEWAEASCRAIDLERGGRPAGELAEAIASELLSGGVELEIGLRADGLRTAPRSVRQDAQPGPLPLGPSDVVVASGGARGVTAATLIALARASRARFALLGRTALEDEPAACRGADGEAALKAALVKAATSEGQRVTPAEIGRSVAKILANREVRATLDAIRAAGGEALYVPADVNDARAVAAALDGVRRALGPVTAIVHGAGVLADKLVAEKTVEQFERVFSTKVDGLRALLGATAGDPLKAIVLFSSIAARGGNKGQCDYAMANEVLNKVAAAEAARRPGCRVKSLGWGPWQGGMVNAALEAHFAQLGVPLIPLAAGAKMLLDELCDASGDRGDRGARGQGGAPPGAVELVLGAEPKALAAQGHGGRVALAVRADRATHPYLGDHAINGVPVVPVVIALEWFARAARACRPDLVVTELRDVRVLRGIKLAAYETGGEVFRVDCREVSNGHGAVLAAELRGPQGALHYAATIQMQQPEGRVAPKGPAAPELGPWPSGGELYDGRTLFHGRDFQVIRRLDGVSREGIAGTVVGLREAGWVAQPWKTDPAALDGGLQLATLWTQHVLGGAALPMSVGALHTFAEGPSDGPLRAVVRGQIVARDRTKADIAFVDDRGSLVAELRDVQYVLRPDTARGQA